MASFLRQSPPIRTPFVPGTSRPNPQSQSLSRGYGSILPTSLIYIVLSTRGCTPWRPEAVMSTTRGANKSRHWVFTDRRKRTGQYKKILLCQSLNLIAGQSDSKVYRTVKKKRELFRGSRQYPQFRLCYHSISTFWFGNINPIPFR